MKSDHGDNSIELVQSTRPLQSTRSIVLILTSSWTIMIKYLIINHAGGVYMDWSGEIDWTRVSLHIKCSINNIYMQISSQLAAMNGW